MKELYIFICKRFENSLVKKSFHLHLVSSQSYIFTDDRIVYAMLGTVMLLPFICDTSD